MFVGLCHTHDPKLAVCDCLVGFWDRTLNGKMIKRSESIGQQCDLWIQVRKTDKCVVHYPAGTSS